MRGTGISRRTLLRWSTCVAASPFLGGLARAAAWKPNRPIEVVISYSPGGGADALGRYLNMVVGERTKWPIITLNKPGAGGAIMLKGLQRANPDGHTIGLCLSLQLTQPPAPGVAPFSVDDFTLLAGIARAPMALVTRNDHAITDVPSMKRFAMREKRAIMLGTTPSLEWLGQRLSSALGTEVVSVPFKGGAEMLNSTLGGHVDLFASGGSHLPLEKAGRLRVVVALTRERLPTSPDAASLYEQGIKVVIESRFLILGPKNMPPDVVGALSHEFAAVMRDTAVREHLESRLSLISAHLGPEELKRALVAEAALQS